MSYQNHAWKHRPRWLGGTDPIEPALPFALAVSGASPQFIDFTQEVDWGTGVGTNDVGVFSYDPDDPGGILIKQAGFYVAMTSVRVGSGDIAVQRRVLIKHGHLSEGPIPGGDFGDGRIVIGDGQADNSLNEVTETSEPKSNLDFIAAQALPAPNDPWNPWRLSVIAAYIVEGQEYTISNNALLIVRIGQWALSVPPLPPSEP